MTRCGKVAVDVMKKRKISLHASDCPRCPSRDPQCLESLESPNSKVKPQTSIAALRDRRTDADR